jgi:DNA-binding MarR family transcriptional regulator
MLVKREAPMSELQDLAGHLIRRLNQISASVFADHMARHGLDLTPVQYAALSALSDMPGIDQARLAGAIAYDRATIGGVVDRLVAKDLVERKVSDRDRRARELRLTARGTRLLDQVRPAVHRLQAEILQGLDAAERDELLRLLQKATEAGNTLSRAPLRATDGA